MKTVRQMMLEEESGKTIEELLQEYLTLDDYGRLQMIKWAHGGGVLGVPPGEYPKVEEFHQFTLFERVHKVHNMM